jgi:hypothetical protein
VFSTSTVCPDIDFTMSPGLVARPDGMFSHAGIRPTTFSFDLSSAMVRSEPSTAAAPHMSNFIWSMSPAGLIEMPPVSNVIPLPTSTSGFCFFPDCSYSSTMNRGGSSLPCVTERNVPMPSASISARSRILTLTSGNSLPSSCARSAR